MLQDVPLGGSKHAHNKSKMADGRHLEKRKLQNLQKGLTDFDEKKEMEVDVE